MIQRECLHPEEIQEVVDEDRRAWRWFVGFVVLVSVLFCVTFGWMLYSSGYRSGRHDERVTSRKARDVMSEPRYWDAYYIGWNDAWASGCNLGATP